MISVKHLTKCYGEFTAVDDLSFEIDEVMSMVFWDLMVPESLQL